MKSLTKTDAAFEELRRMIYSGELRPGQRLPVSELLVILGISPTPIREALRLLQAAGLVVHEPHHGMIVRTYSAPDLDEIYELRAILEPHAAERAARTATPDQLSAIQLAYEHMQSLTISPSRTKGALQKIANSHTTLFNAILAASNSKIAIDFISQLRASPETSRPMHQWEDTLDEQAALVNAILRADPKQAKKAMTAYILHVRHLSAALADKISAKRAQGGGKA